MSKKGGRGTPDDLDYLFERDIIDEEDYSSFWSQYWKADEAGRAEVVKDFEEIHRIAQGELFGGEEGGAIGGGSSQLSGVVTQIRATAEQQAKAIGGYVVRRTKNGRFSKRGRNFQAIRRGRRHDKNRTEEAT